MPEYYERESLIDALMNYTWHDIDGYEIDDCDAKRAYIEEWLAIASFADVRPVIRGHWITAEEAEKIGDYSKRDTCSVCGHCDWDCTESAYFNFCPNCGADMR